MTARPGNYIQDAFRFRDDDGSETGASWLGLQNENVSLSKGLDRKFRLRVQLSQTLTNANTALTKQYKVRYSINGEAYQNVGAPGANTPIRYTSSMHVTHQQVTTEQLAGLYAFLPGRIDAAANTGNIVWAGTAREDTELEFVLEFVDALISVGHTFDFRVYETTDTALNSYDVTPRLTAGDPATNQPPNTPSIISVEYV
jgi:hypothetical protein